MYKIDRRGGGLKIVLEDGPGLLNPVTPPLLWSGIVNPQWFDFPGSRNPSGINFSSLEMKRARKEYQACWVKNKRNLAREKSESPEDEILEIQSSSV